MATIYNSELSKELIQAARIQTSRDRIPTEIAEKVVPVMEVNPKLLKVCNIIKSGSNTTINTSTTLYTVTATTDFFLCGCALQVINDATSTAAIGTINCVPDEMNTLTALLQMANITGVPTSDAQSIDFNRPIKCKRGSVIQLSNNGAAVGACKVSGSIWGYTIENPNA